MTANGLGIAEGRDLEAESFNLAQMPKYSTKACGGILPNHCYKPFFLGLV